MAFYRSFLLLIFFGGSSFLLPAQNNYQVQRFTTDNGLPSNGIKGLKWEAGTGFLWVATEAGVTRYNGSDFVIFSKANTPELFSERMLFMLKNQEGRIYTSDESGNIFFVLGSRLQYMGQVQLDTRPSTFRLVGLAASGTLFRQSNTLPAADFGFNFNKELGIPVSSSRIILFHKDSLYDYRLGQREPAFITSFEPNAKVFRLGGAFFVFNRSSGFARLNVDTFRTMPMPIKIIDPVTPSAGVYKRLFWENGMKNPILIEGSMAWKLEYGKDGLVARPICTVVPTDALLSYAEYDEKSGILFLGTHSRGIIVIREDRVRSVKRDPPVPDQITSTYSQVALSNGSVLTSGGDVLGGPPPSRLPVKTTFNNFTLLTADSLLWYSHEDTVYRYSYRTGQTAAFFAGSGSITDGFALSGDGLYIANAIGVGIFQGGRFDYLYRYPRPDINSNAPFSMLELKPGVLAIATCNGLFGFDVHTHMLDTLLQPPGTCVRALWKYKDYLFIGTYGKGIYLLKNGVLKPLPLDKNNYLQYAHCFLPDKRGYCWISTNKGLFRAMPEDMVDAFEKDMPAVYYQYYGRGDGMAITELNGGCSPCALALNDSLLSFPSMDGLVWVDLSRPLRSLQEGDIYIDEFYADGRKMNKGSLFKLHLSSGTRELAFSLGFPAWANRENIYIEYQLQPYSKNWELLEIQNNPQIRFSNLPSGDYRLLVRKLSGFGAGNYTYAETSFHIDERWYQEPLIWLLGICFLTAGVIGIVSLRTRQFQIRQNRLQRQIMEKTKELKQKNEELEKTDHIKTRLISIISHDLVTPLKFLHLAGKSLIEKKDQLSEELQRETITEIMNTSKELELLSTNILNWIKYKNEDRRLAKESFNMDQLVTQLFGIFYSMAKQKQIRLINAVDDNLILYQFIEPVKIVVYNLVLNGINFTSEGHILVSSAPTAEGIAITIEDTGVGMTQEQINNIMADHFIISSANVDRRKGNGLGYLIIKDLLKIIRGNLSIRSEKGKGTQVTIRLTVQ
ncbi:MAG TPA: ATP-binding protein [Puia sp.]|nr:ATP-binding protein [Puia sp.]